MSSPIRRNYVQAALESYENLSKVIGDLEESEVYACLDLETASRRRRSIMDRLISRAVRIHELNFKSQLQEKYHGSYQSTHQGR